MRNFLGQFFSSSSFVKNSMILSIGTAISQAIPVIFAPLLSRLFSPDEFGLLALVQSVTVIINVIATGKYESVILISKNKRDAAHLVMVSLLLSFIFSVLCIVIFLFFSNSIATMLNQPRLVHWIFICPVISFLISVYQCYNEWCVKFSLFKQLSFNKIINTSSLTISNLTIGITSISSGGLVIGEFLGRFFTAVISMWNVLRFNSKYFKSVSVLRLKKMFFQYKQCPLFIMPAQLLNTVASQFAILILGFYFGEAKLGLYSMTNMVLAVPVSVLSLAIRDVFRQRANDEFLNKGNAKDLYVKTVKVLSVFSFLMFGLFVLFLPDIFSFVLGDEWREAGVYAQILSPTVMISFVAESVFGMFIVAERMRAVLYWQLLYFVISLLSWGVGCFYFTDIRYVLWCYTIGRSVAYLVNLFLSYKYAQGNLR
ncbi:MAG: oligosaccharide flippase family protein [Bacteroidales bacterium]|nr:oligosaccharide flippase family protein [Bacteroidales bacterium]